LGACPTIGLYVAVRICFSAPLKQKHKLVVYFTAMQAGLGSAPPQLLKRAKIVLHYHR
jgi:hypothetical protein